ncbi:MAG: efflux RND transporter periplasmic adaptor subunit [Candidatus Methylopumilus sp.]|jgi:Cu(I)/Ag(I) efflux system membrane fusion protein
MKPALKISLAAFAVIVVVALAYWLGARSNQTAMTAQVKTEANILYYRNPMGLPDTSPVPKQDSMGMDYIPVYEASAASAQAKQERKILYYRNPMGMPDTSDVPKQDSMGMDYIPVYEGEDEPALDGAITVKISTDKVQKLGVKTEKAALRQLSSTVRAVGRIEPDERRVYTIAPKFEGWVEQLHVDATGDVVKAGQVLFDVYSPELISAQREYLIALQGVKTMQDAAPEAQGGMQELAQASLMRLQSWDIGAEDLRKLRETGEVKRTIAYRSPVTGIVMEKLAQKGMRFMPGEMMYKISDLSTLWIIADVAEQESGLLRVGQAARVRLDAYPGREFSSRVSYVYPTLNAQTRTTAVRLQMANPSGLLRPGMYAQLELSGLGSKGRVVSVPDTAVIYSGRREIVLVQLAEGRYEAREVKLGARSDDYVEVKKGVGAGESVVVSANFLIDAESNLKAVIAGFNQAEKDKSGNK